MSNRQGRFAEAARFTNENPDCAYAKAIGGMNCWQAAIEMARLVGAIDDAAAQDMNDNAIRAEPQRFRANLGSRIASTQEMAAVSAGQFIVFERREGNSMILSHVMVSLGDGKAVGTNNMAVGGQPNWSVMDLVHPTQLYPTGVLNWTAAGATYDGCPFDVYARPIDALARAEG